MTDKPKHKSKHIKLTSHPGAGGAKPIAIHWGAAEPKTRGPIIATLTNPDHRNVIGTHSGSYAIYRALAQLGHELELDNASSDHRLGRRPVEP